MDYTAMKKDPREPRSIRDILLDMAEDPDDDYGKTLRQMPSIQEGLQERYNKQTDLKK